jgi:hypothetical protein
MYVAYAPQNSKKLNKEINAAIADPKITARLADVGGTALVGTAAGFGKRIAGEIEKCGQRDRSGQHQPRMRAAVTGRLP